MVSPAILIPIDDIIGSDVRFATGKQPDCSGWIIIEKMQGLHEWIRSAIYGEGCGNDTPDTMESISQNSNHVELFLGYASEGTNNPGSREKESWKIMFLYSTARKQIIG